MELARANQPSDAPGEQEVEGDKASPRVSLSVHPLSSQLGNPRYKHGLRKH